MSLRPSQVGILGVTSPSHGPRSSGLRAFLVIVTEKSAFRQVQSRSALRAAQVAAIPVFVHFRPYQLETDVEQLICLEFAVQDSRKARLASNCFPDEPLIYGRHKCIEVFTKHRMTGSFHLLHVESATAQHNSIFGANERTGLGHQVQFPNVCSGWHLAVSSSTL